MLPTDHELWMFANWRQPEAYATYALRTAAGPDLTVMAFASIIGNLFGYQGLCGDA